MAMEIWIYMFAIMLIGHLPIIHFVTGLILDNEKFVHLNNTSRYLMLSTTATEMAHFMTPRSKRV
jgi:hypothetical protein